MDSEIIEGSFVWSEEKESLNLRVHGIDFRKASRAFFDPDCIIAIDEAHSQTEPRYFCIGKVIDRVATVRFTYRGAMIRIIGAGYWRKGRLLYEKNNKKSE